MTRAIMLLVVTAACGGSTKELSRTPTILSARLEPSDVRVSVAELVDYKDPCPLGESIGRFSCARPRAETEHLTELVVRGGSAGEPRTIDGTIACMFASPDQGCIVGHPWSADAYEVGPKHPAFPIASDLAIRATGVDRVIAGRHGACFDVRADGTETPLGDCAHARFLDPTHVVLRTHGGEARVIELERGSVIGRDDPMWLGGGVALVRRDQVTHLVIVDGWQDLETVSDVRAQISSPDELTLVGRAEIVDLTRGAPINHAVIHDATIDRVLDARDHRIEVSLVRPDRQLEVATIDITTGAVLARAIVR
ncbi:MAG: hypothetical protein QM831_05380 [Kofleriaceae bacterium]